jgi:cytochrome c oxidase subunit 2
MPPVNSYEIQVVAKKWSWSFIYPNGHVDNQLHMPVDRPVTLVMSSDDVIHSLYVPAFRVKMDLVPGRYTKTWFEATEVGTYPLFCAEYCGTGHSTMNSSVIVHRSGEFEKWLEDAADFMKDLTPVEAGQILYSRRGCAQCHSVDGTAMVGPSFKNAFGSHQMMTSGEEILVDENYIRESILEPQAKVRSGYRAVMPTYKGQLKDEEISALIQFIKSLR